LNLEGKRMETFKSEELVGEIEREFKKLKEGLASVGKMKGS